MGSELEGRLEGKRTRELDACSAAFQRDEQGIAAELDASRRLQQVATQLITAQGTEALFENILDTTVAILHSDFASIQMFHPERGACGELRLLDHSGFSPQAAKRWEWVTPSSRTTCGEALRTRRRVAVPDVRECDFMAGSKDLDELIDAGIFAAQSTPLISRSGALLGMISSQWLAPHELSANEVRALDILARLASDLIERSRVFEALEESERRLACIYDTVRDVIFHLAVEPDGQFRFLSVNAAFLNVTGLSREMVLGKTVDQVIPEPSLSMVLGKYRQAIDGETAVLWEETSDYPVGRLTGEVSVVPVFDKNGACTHLVGSVHDITPRKKAEAQLRESEERFRHMADHAPVMIWICGPDKLCTFFNKRWLDFVGRGLQAELCAGWLPSVHPDDLNDVLAIYSSAFEKRQSYQIEHRMRRADGEYRWILASGVPRFSESGGFSGYIGSCIDVTELRRTQEQVLRAQKLESLGVLAGGIAHDFNNLLASILIDSDAILSSLSPGSPGQEEAERIVHVATRAAEIVRQLMAYAGKEAATFAALDLGQLIAELSELMKFSIGKNATLDVRISEDLPPVRANTAQMQQLVMNLLTNASEAIGAAEGTIRIVASRAGIPNTLLDDRGADGGAYVRLDVHDTGCGMSKEIQDHIFEPFFTTKFAGRGLGLASVQGIVRNHRGAINVVSSPGEGTCFSVFLPVAVRELQAIHQERSLDAYANTCVAGSVLVVEDEDSLRLAVSKMLRNAGLSVVEAADGQTAIDMSHPRLQRIAVVLLDMTLPGLPAREVITKLRQMRPDVKIILTTAYSQAEVINAIGELTVSAFIRKPYSPTDLLNLIRKVSAADGNPRCADQSLHSNAASS